MALARFRRLIGARPSRAHARGHARAFLSVAIVALLLLPTTYAAAIISTTITIDADFGDWAGVRGDAANTVHDTQLSDPDPDWPGQPDRDTYLCNATWDDEYLYLAFRRTAGGTKAITFAAYIDRGADGLLQDTDVVAWWTVGQSTSSRYADAHAASPTAGIFKYNQAINGKGGPYTNPGGDPMGHDGETPDGWADVQSGNLPPALPMDGWLASNGIEFEGKVAWDDLGLEPGSPMAIHFANANGESFGVKWVPSNTYKNIGGGKLLEENRGQIEDNVDGIWWLSYRAVDVSPDNVSGGVAGETVIYEHTITNDSNVADTFDLSVSSGWPAVITDTSDNPLSSVSLAPGASTTVRVRVTIPLGTTDGSRSTATLTATSQADASITDSATDITSAGRVTVTPDQSGSMAPGQSITYRFTVNNNTGALGTYDLTALSSLGWTTHVTDTSGAVITSVDLAGGATQDILVTIDVPPGATVGMQDVTRLTATLRGTPSVKSSASATTEVLGPLVMEPNRQGYTGAGTTIDYTHTITNSWPTARTATLAYSTPHGWPVKFFAADGITEITSVDLGAYGDSQDFIVRVYVPTGVAANTVDAMQVRATAGGLTVTCTDTTTIRRLAVYEDAGYTSYSSDYTLGDRIYARATGLSAGSNVYFKWYDAAGNLVDTSPVRTVDTAGMAFDDYQTLMTQRTGGWRCELYNSSNALLETSYFNVHWNAEITALAASDAPTVGSSTSITSSVRNDNSRAISGSTVTYTIWWDENGNGTFDAGDTYIDSSGIPHTWNGSTAVNSHVTTGVDVPAGSSADLPVWTMSNTQFPHQGDYRVTAVWTESAASGGFEIDRSTTEFFSIPALGWPLFGVTFLFGAFALWRRRELGTVVARIRRGGEAA